MFKISLLFLAIAAACNGAYFGSGDDEKTKTLPPNCVGYWPLNWQTGPRDVSNKEIHGRLYNHPTLTAGPFNQPQSAFNLNPDSYIELPLNTFGHDESFTVSMFTKFNEQKNLLGSPLFEWARPADDKQYGAHLWFWSDERPEKAASTLWFNTGNCGYVTLDCPSSTSNTDWRHVAVSYDKDTNTLRLVCQEATKVFPLPRTCRLDTTQTALIGQRNVSMDHNLHFNGSVACLSIYRTAMMKKEDLELVRKLCRRISEVTTQPAPVDSRTPPFVNRITLPSSCVAYWPLMSTWPSGTQDLAPNRITAMMTAWFPDLRTSNEGPFGKVDTSLAFSPPPSTNEPGHVYFNKVPVLTQLSRNSFTVSMFVKLDKMQPSPLFEYSYRNRTTTERAVVLWLWPDGNTFHFQSAACEFEAFAEVRCPYEGSVWHHVAAIYNKEESTILAYCDGAVSSVYHLKPGCKPTTTDLLYLGYRDFEPGHNRLFDGKMACVSIYNVPLTPEQLMGSVKSTCRSLSGAITAA